MDMNRSSLMAAAGLVLFAVAVTVFIPPVVPAAGLPAADPDPLPPVSQTRVPHTMGDVQLSFAPVVKRVAPAVVNVYSRSVVQAPANPFFGDPFFQQFFGNPQMRQRVQQSLGSGVIVRADGVIVTNDHVIRGGEDIVVALSDKREFKAKVLLADPHTDLAVLKIDTRGEKLPIIEFGDSDRVETGDLVLAVGDPFGVGQTVTMGIVSALARTNVTDGEYRYFIQTDAAINPGNSGGALVTTDGRLAGINTAIFSRTGDYAGIGFAIPSNLARRVVEGALGGGVKLPWIGVDGQAVTQDLAQSMGLAKPGGVLLKSVFPGGPAARAALRTGDVVFAADGTPVDDMEALNYRVATHKAGDVLKLRVRQNGQMRDVAVRLDLPPENPPRDLTTIGGRNPLTGAKVENLSPAVAGEMQMSLMDKGVVVASPGNSIAAGQGFQPGDVIVSVNGAAIHDVGELQRALGNAGGHWDMIVDRGGQRMTLSVDG
jgi:Do/DeqQ family serine protease